MTLFPSQANLTLKSQQNLHKLSDIANLIPQNHHLFSGACLDLAGLIQLRIFNFQLAVCTDNCLLVMFSAHSPPKLYFFEHINLTDNMLFYGSVNNFQDVF